MLLGTDKPHLSMADEDDEGLDDDDDIDDLVSRMAWGWVEGLHLFCIRQPDRHL